MRDDDPIEAARLAREAEERRRASLRHPGAEASDFPPPVRQGRRGEGNPHVDTSQPRHVFERFSRSWGALIALIVGAVALVDIGVRVAARNESYATTKELERVNQRLDGIATKLDELKASDIKPIAMAASQNALDAQMQVAVVAKEVHRITKSINGFNARATARHQITPLPLQDD